MKKYITRLTILYFLITMLWIVSFLYPEYIRYYTYFSIAITLPLLIFDLIRKRKEDKLNDAIGFKLSIYSMVIMIAILVAFFFVTKQNYI